LASSGDCSGEDIATARHRLEYALVNIPDGTADVADALRYRIISDDNIGPNGLIDRVTV
jgi:hypothetical protein